MMQLTTGGLEDDNCRESGGDSHTLIALGQGENVVLPSTQIHFSTGTDATRRQAVMTITNKQIVLHELSNTELLFIPGLDIEMHAESDGSAPSVYMQVKVSEGESENEFTDMLLFPSNGVSCTQIFRTITELVKLHPDDNDGEECDEMAPIHSDVEATEEERQAMLERLDDLLYVPKQYELQQSPSNTVLGQFDDAEE